MKIRDLLNEDLTDESVPAQWCYYIGLEQGFQGASIDSRSIVPGQLFVALKGDHVDGHDYVETAYNKGATLFLVGRAWADENAQSFCHQHHQAGFIVVNDTREGLAHLAMAWRNLVNLRWVAVTGSCGKTSVKEMAACILRSEGRCVATKGNQNNQVGVPLTLLSSVTEDQFGVAELGADHKGEIEKTVAWVKPQAALINNVNPAHLDGFGSLEGIADAKSEIFSTLGGEQVAVLNRDDVYYNYWVKRIRQWGEERSTQIPRIITFGEHAEADYQLVSYQAGAISEACIKIFGEENLLRMSLLGKHNYLNALAALALVDCFSIPFEQAQTALSALKPIKGRLRPIKLSENILMIDDAYNANPGSVAQAIKTLQVFEGVKVLVLGDMLELGDTSVQAHQEVGHMAASVGLNVLLSFGNESASSTGAFNQLLSKQSTAEGDTGRIGKHFESITELIDWLKQFTLETFDQETFGQQTSANKKLTVLVKGSRSMRMERVYEAFS